MDRPLLILVDTNVWIDNYVPVREGSAHSQEFIVAALSAGANLLYPVHALKDVFYNIGATIKHIRRSEGAQLSQDDALAIQEIAWACVNNLCELATAAPADEADAWLARKYRSVSSDLEDNFVMVAAERIHADLLVTRDEGLLRACTVAALSPEDAMGFLAARG